MLVSGTGARPTRDRLGPNRGRFEVIGIGALNIDEVWVVPSLAVRDNESALVNRVTSSGGSAANTIYALARLGVATAYVGAVGKDPSGQTLRDSFSEVGVSNRWIITKTTARTGVALCLADKAGERFIVVEEGANRELCEDDVRRITPSLVLPTRIAHLTSFIGEPQFRLQVNLIEKLPAETLISLSPGMIYAQRGYRGILPLATRCDVLFVNRREIATLMGTDQQDFASAASQFLDKFVNCQAVVVTLGSGRPPSRSRQVPHDITTIGRAVDERAEVKAKPDRPVGRQSCWVLTRGGESSFVYYRFRKAVDPTGAGDAFAAGYLYGMVNDEPVWRCALFGHTLAQFSVSGIGARGPHLPTRRDFEVAVENSSAVVWGQ
jgi:ribokinase